MFDARMDATPQQGMAFMIAQASYIEPEVYKIQYADLQYSTVLPIDTSAPDWIDSVTFFSMDGVAKADWLARGADDVRNVATSMNKYETGIETAGIGYEYDLFEIRKAIGMRMNLTTDRADLARRGAEEMIENISFFGDTRKSILGLANQPSVTILPPGTAAAGGVAWANKTAAEIRLDANALLNSSFLGSSTVEMADTLLIPVAAYLKLAETVMSDLSPNQGTVLDYVKKLNLYTQRTGQPLTVAGILGLETAGAGGVTRAIAYKKDPRVVKMHMPMPFQFFPVREKGSFAFHVPGAFRLGGVDVRRPAAFRYMDGI